MKGLIEVALAPDLYEGGSIQDSDFNRLEILAGGVIFKSGNEAVVLPCTPPHNYGELKACIKNLQAEADAKSKSLGFQNVLQRWWSVLTN